MQTPRPISRKAKPRIPGWPFFSVVPAIATTLITLALLAIPVSAEVIIELTQTPCTIIEAELEPRTFTSTGSDDCIRINKETLSKGEREFKELRLKPGRTIFRVTNKDVPYELGFWVRGKGFGRVTLPSISGGGLMEGETKDYVIDLTAGEYLYSCPLNPTPNYPLIVE